MEIPSRIKQIGASRYLLIPKDMVQHLDLKNRKGINILLKDKDENTFEVSVESQ